MAYAWHPSPWKAEGEDYELQPGLYSETHTTTSKNI